MHLPSEWDLQTRTWTHIAKPGQGPRGCRARCSAGQLRRRQDSPGAGPGTHHQSQVALLLQCPRAPSLGSTWPSPTPPPAQFCAPGTEAQPLGLPAAPQAQPSDCKLVHGISADTKNALAFGGSAECACQQACSNFQGCLVTLNSLSGCLSS